MSYHLPIVSFSLYFFTLSVTYELSAPNPESVTEALSSALTTSSSSGIVSLANVGGPGDASVVAAFSCVEANLSSSVFGESIFWRCGAGEFCELLTTEMFLLSTIVLHVRGVREGRRRRVW